jgi:pimeloyl-ACP methyl ester carboxylesterase
MNYIFITLNLFFLFVCSISCKKEEVNVHFSEKNINLETHQLASFSVIQNTEFLVVFESGLGDDHSVWLQKKVADKISKKSDVLLYDRAGYGKSSIFTQVRDINRLCSELNAVISHFSQGRKLILVGHSLGGMLIRDYAIKYPSQIAALVFVDASHELYNNPTQQEEDAIYQLFKDAYSENFGATAEAKELIENSQYMATLPNLPDVPVIAITSMKTDTQHNEADRQLWFDSKEALKQGVTDFTHVVTYKSGHYIMVEEPELIFDTIETLLLKLKK